MTKKIDKHEALKATLWILGLVLLIALVFGFFIWIAQEFVKGVNKSVIEHEYQQSLIPNCTGPIEYSCYRYSNGFLNRKTSVKVSCNEQYDWYKGNNGYNTSCHAQYDKGYGKLNQPTGDTR